MIEDLRKWVLGQLRMGADIQDVVDAFHLIGIEINKTSEYVRAIKDSDFRP